MNKVIEKIFRYRSSDNLYYSYEVWTTWCIDLLSPFDNLDWIIEQYIWECDKNKKMIFENDILDYFGRKIKVKIPDIYREEISFNDTLIIK